MRCFRSYQGVVAQRFYCKTPRKDERLNSFWNYCVSMVENDGVKNARDEEEGVHVDEEDVGVHDGAVDRSSGNTGKD